jgi:hypothetical protein
MDADGFPKAGISEAGITPFLTSFFNVHGRLKSAIRKVATMGQSAVHVAGTAKEKHAETEFARSCCGFRRYAS